jgi:hypothetical protein
MIDHYSVHNVSISTAAPTSWNSHPFLCGLVLMLFSNPADSFIDKAVDSHMENTCFNLELSFCFPLSDLCHLFIIKRQIAEECLIMPWRDAFVPNIFHFMIHML